MDFTDYCVLPHSSLSNFWKISHEIFVKALTLEGNARFKSIISNQKVCKMIYGTSDPKEAE